ncbi:MAG: hypothetical protein WCR31_10165 [Treponema sp.]
MIYNQAAYTVIDAAGSSTTLRRKLAPLEAVRDNFAKYLLTMDFVAIDFETAKRSMESACAVGLVKYLGDEKVDSFYSLIRPPVLYVRPDFTEIHGITVDDVRDAPDLHKYLRKDYSVFVRAVTFVTLYGGRRQGCI